MKSKIIKLIQIVLLIVILCLTPKFLYFMEKQDNILKLPISNCIENSYENNTIQETENIIVNDIVEVKTENNIIEQKQTTSRGNNVKKQNTKSKTKKTNTSKKTTNSSNIGYIKFVATAYCPCKQCCGKTNGITASGNKAKAGVTVAMPSKYKFGTKIDIKGMGTYIVQDRGGAISGNRIDIFFNTHKEALKFGRRTVYLKVLK